MHESGAAALLLPATDSHIRTPGLFKTECLGKKDHCISKKYFKWKEIIRCKLVFKVSNYKSLQLGKDTANSYLVPTENLQWRFQRARFYNVK